MLDTYHFDRMVLHDIAVTQDCQRMLCVGTLMASRDGLHPSKSRAEKQIIGMSTSYTIKLTLLIYYVQPST